MNDAQKDSTLKAIKLLMKEIYSINEANGWHEESDPRTFGDYMMLQVTELAEAYEAYRNHNPESEKIPGFSHIAEELADDIIRALDYCEKNDIPIAEAIFAKIAHNATRGYRHGGKLT